MRPASTVTPSASVSWIVAAVVKTFPVVTAPSAAKHTAASHIVLIIFQSLRPLRQDSLRFYWSRCAAECLSIVAIPKTQPSSARRSAHESWQQLRDSRESKRFRLFAFQDGRCDFRWERKANRSHQMRRNHLKGGGGDRINAVLAAAGYNFSLLLRWFRRLLCALLLILARAVLVTRFA